MIAKSKILVTGAAGFIGFHLIKKMLDLDLEVVGLDNINNYYDQGLKYSRLNESGINKNEIDWNHFAQSKNNSSYRFIRMNLENKEEIFNLFKNEQFDYVIHLAAQAGVRYSIEEPDVYINSNIFGFFNILEACRYYPVRQLIYASSSSVYGNSLKIPFKEDDNTDQPISLYAATKKSNELMAYTYSHLFKIHCTGLRFFTVYGPWGRPDMALFKFTKAIYENKAIDIYNAGELFRDFTYIDDIVDGIILLFENNKAKKIVPVVGANCTILNLGNNSPVKLIDFITILEKAIGKIAIKNYLPMQAGDVTTTYASIERLNDVTGYIPRININKGIEKFVAWYQQYYRIPR